LKTQFDFLNYLNQLRFSRLEASTIESNVVGILKSIPRLNVEATKPPKSVTTPPPRFIIRLFCQRKLRENIPNLDAGINVFIFFTRFKLDNFDSKLRFYVR
jgi:hypothetical protein